MHDDPPGMGVVFTELGKTSLVGEYQYSENGQQAGDIGHSWSVIVEQKIDAAAMDVFLRYTNFNVNRDGTTFLDDDISALGLGARMKF